MRWALVALAFATLLLATLAPEASAPESVYFATVVPAPVGYALTFHGNAPGRISGVRTASGDFVAYRADPSSTGAMIYISPGATSFNVAKLVGEGASGELRVAEAVPLSGGYLVATKAGSFILRGSGTLYASRYTLLTTTSVPPDVQNPLIVGLNQVHFWVGVPYLLAVDSPSLYITVYTGNETLQLPLHELLGIPKSCVYAFEDAPWVGGVALSPACTGNIVPLKTFTYKNAPFAVVFAARTKYGKIDYVVMRGATYETLEMVGVVSRVDVDPSYHIVTGVDPSLRYYLVGSPSYVVVAPEPLEVVDAGDITVNDGGRRICTVPENATLMYAVLWKWRNLTGPVELAPGEVVLFDYAGNKYVCSGILSWIWTMTSFTVAGPPYREIPSDISISSTDYPVLVVLANGKVYYAGQVVIPRAEYEGNEVFVCRAGYISRVNLQVTSFFLSPPFLIIVILSIAVFYVARSSGRSPERKTVRVVFDVPQPKPLKQASRDTVMSAIKKHVFAFGVCPDDVELAMYHGVLPPLSPRRDPAKPRIYCFKTNKRTERLLRKVTRILTAAMWANKRAGKSHGVFYTVIGGYMPYFYYYKREDEEEPARVLVNAVEKAYGVRLNVPYHAIPMGLVIFAEKKYADAIRAEVELLRTMRDPSSDVVSFSRYVRHRGIRELRRNPKLVESFMRDKVPEILVVSDDNVTELIEFLAEKVASLGELQSGAG